MAATAGARTRPKDRKQQIEAAAALAFATRGYHRVSMAEVAAEVGISASALYRHFSNKYELFLRAAFHIAGQLSDRTDAIDQETCDTPERAREQLARIIDELIETTIELRAVGGIYRWEGRYLEAEDRARLTALFTELRDRVARRLAVLHPDSSPDERDVAVWAALGAIASVTAHRVVLSANALKSLIRDVSWRALEAKYTVVSDGLGSDGQEHAHDTTPAAQRPGLRAPKRRERIVSAAASLIAARGFHEVTIEEIARESGLTASGVYRHFDGKASILLEAYEAAAAALAAGMRRAYGVLDAAGATAAVRVAAADYVTHSAENWQLMRVYFAELSNLEAAQQRRLRGLQRVYVDHWAELLRLARPNLSERQSTVLVHTAFGVVSELLTRAHVLKRSRDEGTVAQVVVACETVLGLNATAG